MSTTLSLPTGLSTALAALDEARMLALTATLCAPDFAGRLVGTEGHARASAFLRDQFRQADWAVSIQDFSVTAPVVELMAPLHLAQLALLDTVPQGNGFTDLADQLAKQGAISFLTPLYANADGYMVKRITAVPPVALPVLSVRADLLPPLADTLLQARVPVVSRQPRGTNVLASLSGTDEWLAQAPLLIGAHYDALGDDPDGLRYPGATDNAAAVAVLLELARILPRLSTPLRRPIMLVAFDAEEVGAHGSHALTRQFKETGKTPLVLNLAGAAKLHTPADAIELVQPAALGIAARLLLATIWQLAWEE